MDNLSACSASEDWNDHEHVLEIAQSAVGLAWPHSFRQNNSPAIINDITGSANK